MSQTPSLADVISNALEARLDEVYTALPGQITKFNEATGTASVFPLVRKQYTAENGDEVNVILPTLQNVPVMFPGCGKGYGMTFPVEKGDNVLLVFSSGSLDQWKRAKTNAPPPAKNSNRKHSLSDAICIPGLRAPATAKATVASRVTEETLTLYGARVDVGGRVNLLPVVRDLDMVHTIIDVLTNPSVAAAIVALAAASSGGPGAVAAAVTSAITALNNHFLTTPAECSDNVRAT